MEFVSLLTSKPDDPNVKVLIHKGAVIIPQPEVYLLTRLLVQVPMEDLECRWAVALSLETRYLSLLMFSRFTILFLCAEKVRLSNTLLSILGWALGFNLERTGVF
jgi:hypothetical protein